MALSREIDARLKTKCDMVADAFVMDDIGRSIAPYHFLYNFARMSYKCKFDDIFFGFLAIVVFS